MVAILGNGGQSFKQVVETKILMLDDKKNKSEVKKFGFSGELDNLDVKDFIIWI